MQRTGIENANFSDGVILDRKLVTYEDEVVLLLVEESAEEFAVLAVDRDDALAIALEVGDGAEAFDADGVPVAHQPHAVAVPIAPDKPARHTQRAA
jgi:hypothetical protein